MSLAPRPHPLNLGRAAKVIAVVRGAEPTALAGRLAGLSARRLGTGVLALGAARHRPYRLRLTGPSTRPMLALPCWAAQRFSLVPRATFRVRPSCVCLQMGAPTGRRDVCRSSSMHQDSNAL